MPVCVVASPSPGTARIAENVPIKAEPRVGYAVVPAPRLPLPGVCHPGAGPGGQRGRLTPLREHKGCSRTGGLSEAFGTKSTGLQL